jgi:hypothetical protein
LFLVRMYLYSIHENASLWLACAPLYSRKIGTDRLKLRSDERPASFFTHAGTVLLTPTNPRIKPARKESRFTV